MTDDLGEVLDRIKAARRAHRAPRARQVVAYECATCRRMFRSRTAAEDHCRILSGATPWPPWPKGKRRL